MDNIETCEMLTFFMLVVLGQKCDFYYILGFHKYLVVHINISFIYTWHRFWDLKWQAMLSNYFSGLTSLSINAPHFMSYFLKLVNSTMTPSLKVCIYILFMKYVIYKTSKTHNHTVFATF